MSCFVAKSGKEMKKGAVIITIVVSGVLFLLKSSALPLGKQLSQRATDIFGSIGLVKDEVRIAGTGSMYPTFPKGKGETDVARAQEIVAWSAMRRYPGGILLAGRRYGGYTIARGDIVSFFNEKTKAITMKQYGEEAGFVKRAIAIAGDTVEIRDGFVIVNGVRQKEPYTARPRSTFGGEFLPDCRPLLVPEGYIFVLGDNRIGSNDSRYDIELVNNDSIDHVLPYADQKDYSSHWRDASGDDALIFQPTLDVGVYVRLLNEKRRSSGLKELKFDQRLASSAQKRGEVMLSFNDISFEATKSGYTTEHAFAQAGYSNIVWGEFPALGYYDASELIENTFEFPKSREFLLEKKFQDVGVAAVLGEINGCPTQLVVQHFGGYVPPNYTADVVKSWKDALTNLQDIQSGWERARTIPQLYDKKKVEIDRIIDIIRERIAGIGAVVSRMEHNQWLTAEETAYTKRDNTLFVELDRLIQQVNSM